MYCTSACIEAAAWNGEFGGFNEKNWMRAVSEFCLYIYPSTSLAGMLGL